MFLPFTPTLTNFAPRQTKETGPTEIFLEKYRFCPKTAHSVVQPWCKKEKEKMQVFENQALAFCWVPGAGIEPARIAPLVFETSASTDSAIRAGVLFQLPVGVGLRWQGGMLGHPGCFLSGRFDQG